MRSPENSLLQHARTSSASGSSPLQLTSFPPTGWWPRGGRTNVAPRKPAGRACFFFFLFLLFMGFGTPNHYTTRCVCFEASLSVRVDNNKVGRPDTARPPTYHYYNVRWRNSCKIGRRQPVGDLAPVVLISLQDLSGQHMLGRQP